MNWPEIFTALITPYGPGGAVDGKKAGQLAQMLWQAGCEGFIVAGSTGEAFALSLAERETLYRSVREALPAAAAVWVGTGSNDTRATVELTQAAHGWGADGMLVVTPYYNKPPESGLVHHFVEAARQTDRPIMIYDVPGRTGLSLTPEVVLRARQQCDNIVAVKEAAGTITAMIAMHRALPTEVRLYTGDDGLLLPSLAAGAHGVVSVASHVATPTIAAVIAAYRAGHPAEALRQFETLVPLADALFMASNPIPLKWLLNQLGWEVGSVRPPLAMLPDSVLAPVWSSYQRFTGTLHLKEA